MTTPTDASESVVETGTRRRSLGRRSHGSAISPFQVVVLVVVVAAGLVAWQLTRPNGATYRTTTVGTGTVVATLSSVGTINPVNQANLNFNVAGTVGAVDVAVGQQVTAGEVVASLDPTPLQNAVVTDEAGLASAQASLASDEASQAGATTSAATLTSVITAGTPSGGGAPSSNGSPVSQLQATLVADQKREDADSTAVGSAIAAATSTCTAPAPAVSPASSFTPTAGSTQSSLSPSTPSPTAAATSTAPTCTQLLSAASSAQAALATDIKTVAADEAGLTAALEAAASTGSGGSSPNSTGSSGAGSSGSGSKSGSAGTGAATGTTGAAASGSGSGSSKAKAVTAQKLALDQASIDVALANLDNAQKSLAAANLVTTISGTVGAVTLTVGASVSAGATTTTGQVVVLGSGASYQLVAALPVAKISQVAVGQQAMVTPDSSSTVVHGTVTSIGVLATSGTTSTTYPVTVSFQSSTLGLYSGAEAELSIVTSRAVGVTTVPTSAVHTVGTSHLVTVVDGNTTKQVRVGTGTVGAVLTQVTSGLKLGQRVSMADLNQSVPSSSTTSTRSGFAGVGGGAGGFPGGTGGFGGAGGFPGGGFRGGAPGG